MNWPAESSALDSRHSVLKHSNHPPFYNRPGLLCVLTFLHVRSQRVDSLRRFVITDVSIASVLLQIPLPTTVYPSQPRSSASGDASNHLPLPGCPERRVPCARNPLRATGTPLNSSPNRPFAICDCSVTHINVEKPSFPPPTYPFIPRNEENFFNLSPFPSMRPYHLRIPAQGRRSSQSLLFIKRVS